jgi:tRNA uridine 5-carboxymethylaminomethyl modification enzyme
MYKSVKGLENSKIMRPAYAIEYDCIDPTQLKISLEIKGVENLFSAGQFNGTSGYEEAAAQGLIAGINAAMKIEGKEPFVLDRSEAYIGVLIDDLVTKGTNEPYRMMTSRSEYRLYLRQDNADMRLTQRGYDIGLVKEDRYQRFLKKKADVENELERLKTERVTPKEVNHLLEEMGASEIKVGISLYEFLKRPEVTYELIEAIGKGAKDVSDEVKEQCVVMTKYEGYIDKQLKQIDQFKKLENKKLSEDIDYLAIDGLRIEARQKLDSIKPRSIGQASRISGVSPADISVLLVYLEQMRRKK